MGVTSSQVQNITSPSGNSLAVFIDGVTGILLLKDINGATEPLSNYICNTENSPFEYNANGTGIQPILSTNNASGCNSTIGGGKSNTASNNYATIGGGLCNNASGCKSTIGGGQRNISNGYSSTIGGGQCNISSGYSSIIGGGYYNVVSGSYSTIGGGKFNYAQCCNSTIGGGLCNISNGYSSTIGGGRYNTASGACSFIGGGDCNTASGQHSSILGGYANKTCGFAYAMIIGSNLCATQARTTFMNCTSVDNLTAGCMVRVGTNKVLENSVSKIGSFFSTQTQCATTTNTPKAMTLNNTDAFSSGVSIVSNSRITVDTAGIYNLQFSAQVDRVTTAGVDLIEIWFRKQGVDIPYSNTKVTVSGSANQAKVVASWNFYFSLMAKEYVELMYSVTDLQVRLVAEAENLVVPYPATPSLIVTIQKIN
jgi:hypothetical protein